MLKFDHLKFQDSARQAIESNEQRDRGLTWGVYDAGISEYMARFQPVLPSGESPIRFLKRELKIDRDKPFTGVDLGGIGSRFFADLKRNLQIETIFSFGVVLKDNRMEEQRHQDLQNNHQVLVGDITKNETIEMIKREIPGGRANFVVESMWGGVMYMPDDLRNLQHLINLWYSLLAPNGIGLFESPIITNEKRISKIKEWEAAVNTAFAGRANIAIAYLKQALDKKDFLMVKVKNFDNPPESLSL